MPMRVNGQDFRQQGALILKPRAIRFIVDPGS
jgi:hypothetical protein